MNSRSHAKLLFTVIIVIVPLIIVYLVAYLLLSNRITSRTSIE